MKGLHSLLSYLGLSIGVICSSLSAQQVQLLSDQSAEPLLGVEVWSEDRSFSGLTDQYGIINLDSWNRKEPMNFRFLGFSNLQLSYTQIEQNNFKVVLFASNIEMKEVVIFGRHKYDTDDISVSIETISKEDISLSNPQTAADAIGQHSQVYIQKSQMGGGSPIIRGFEANRVLLVIDGVRLNNAIYRSGHLQNAISVDPAIMQRMDVIYGPNSLMYGSDALGGVVHFQTILPKFNLTEKWSAQLNAYSRFSTANNEKSIHVDVNTSNNQWSWVSSVTYNNYDDLKSGGNRSQEFPDFGKRLFYQDFNLEEGGDVLRANDNPNLQVGTGYEQIDVVQKLRKKIGKSSTVGINFQLSTTSDVPRYDNLIEFRGEIPRFAEWFYGPQSRILTSVTWDYYRANRWFDGLKVIGAYQKIDEDRITRVWDSTSRERQEEDVHIYSTTFDFTKVFGQTQLRLDYGVDMQLNDVNSQAHSTDIISGRSNNNLLTRYADDYNTQNNFGSYVTLNYNGKRINWNAGLRYSLSFYALKYNQSTLVDWPNALLDGVKGNNQALTGSASIGYNNNGTKIDLLVSSAFRAPNIDDLSKIRINGGEISFPNIDLRPERSFNVEWSFQKYSEDFNISISTFFTRLSDAIIRLPFNAPNGEEDYVSFGDTLRVVANQNASRANIFGWSVQGSYDLSSTLSIEGSYNWIKGEQILDDQENSPLGHIPPAYGKIGLNFHKDNFNIAAVTRFNRFKPIEQFGGSVDNPDLATPIGALSWYTLNLYASYNWSPTFSINLGLENLFDLHYRPFASGVSAPGRNLSITFRAQF